MKIYIGDTEQSIPEWITVESISGGEKLNTEELNDRPGEVFVSSVLKAKTLSCSGHVIASSLSAVETEMSRITNILRGKELKVYRDDDSTVYYLCRLSGDIKAGFYNGRTIGKAFTVQFTLKSLYPWGFGSPVSQSLTAGNNTVANAGNIELVPAITFTGPKTLAGTIVTCGGKSVTLNDTVLVPTGKKLIFSECSLRLDGADITNKLTDASVLVPMVLQSGSNTVSVNEASVLSFTPRYV